MGAILSLIEKVKTFHKNRRCDNSQFIPIWDAWLLVELTHIEKSRTGPSYISLVPFYLYLVGVAGRVLIFCNSIPPRDHVSFERRNGSQGSEHRRDRLSGVAVNDFVDPRDGQHLGCERRQTHTQFWHAGSDFAHQRNPAGEQREEVFEIVAHHRVGHASTAVGCCLRGGVHGRREEPDGQGRADVARLCRLVAQSKPRVAEGIRSSSCPLAVTIRQIGASSSPKSGCVPTRFGARRSRRVWRMRRLRPHPWSGGCGTSADARSTVRVPDPR